MSHEVESMAYANSVPWHGLGKRVDQSIDADAMLIEAGLDWEVIQCPVYATIEGKTIALPQRQALLRATDHKLLTMTGPAWKPFQNKDAIGFFKEYCEAGGATLETAGSLRGGKLIWGLANLQKSFEVGSGDKVDGYLLLVSPHEVGKAITVRTTTVRVVCANTMAMAMRELSGKSYRQSHVLEFDAQAAKDSIEISLQQFAQAEEIAKKLSNLKISEFDTVRLLAKFVQPISLVGESGKAADARIEVLIQDPTNQNIRLSGIMNSIKTAPGAIQGNGWGVINGVTHWADHVTGRKTDTRLVSSWFGGNSRLKLDIQEELLQMAA